MIRRLIAVVLIVAFVAPAAAVGGKKAEYVGGTVADLPERKEGRFDTADPEALTFTPDDRKLPPVTIPYASITGLEYGQKAGRRVAVAVFITPFALFSKKRKHFLTISYTNATGAEDAAIFELGKEIIRTSLTVIQTRSGKAVEYQDDEARKAGRGGN